MLFITYAALKYSQVHNTLSIKNSHMVCLQLWGIGQTLGQTACCWLVFLHNYRLLSCCKRRAISLCFGSSEDGKRSQTRSMASFTVKQATCAQKVKYCRTCCRYYRKSKASDRSDSLTLMFCLGFRRPLNSHKFT